MWMWVNPRLLWCHRRRHHLPSVRVLVVGLSLGKLVVGIWSKVVVLEKLPRLEERY
jgi:hypothetical protein